ncbi:MAG: secondary thiamine-phosphate synthase enzyme YjbQ [Bacteroidota bacterium]
MNSWQHEFQLPAFPRGYHLITDIVIDELLASSSARSAGIGLPRVGASRRPFDIGVGIFQLFIKHTSAALTINENADPDVRVDFESVFNHVVPENLPFLEHTLEGPDDMPAHIKAAMIGQHISIPITGGRLNLGTWQGIYLCEFRNRASGRKLVATVIGG